MLLAASPLFNGNSDYGRLVNKDGTPLVKTTFDKAKWDRAAQAAKAAIDVSELAGIKLYTAVPNGVLSPLPTNK